VGNEMTPELYERLRDEPDQDADLIVTVNGDPNHYVPQVRALGLEVKRVFSLTQKLALAGPSRSFVALSQEDWVIKLEDDKPIRAIS
jgi:hypothetical protein